MSPIIGLALLLGISNNAYAYSVYVLSGGNSASDQAVANALAARGQSATIGPDINIWDGTQADLGDYRVVVLLNNYNWAGSDMPASGIAAIETYVSGGGGLVTGEWLIWNIDSGGSHTGLGPVVPANENGYVVSSSTTYTRITPNPIIDK